MIRAVATGRDGRKILLLGVDARNVERLKAGEPIICTSESVDGLGVDVVIMYGETMTDVLADLRSHGIKVPDDPKLGVMYRGSTEGYHRDEKKKG